MKNGFSEQVAAILTDHGIDDQSAQQQSAFCETLLAENERINLTGITDPAGMAVRHVLDSLLAEDLVADGPADEPLVDLGSGGGVPGIPLALVLPERKVVLVESRERKAAALARIVEAVALSPRVCAVHARGEIWLDEQRVDAVLTRAIGSVGPAVGPMPPTGPPTLSPRKTAFHSGGPTSLCLTLQGRSIRSRSPMIVQLTRWS